jgi:hypothetical protein
MSREHATGQGERREDDFDWERARPDIRGPYPGKLAFQKYFYLHFASFAIITPIMKTETEPKLAAPGAGLPPHELFVGRMIFALGRRFQSRAALRSRFERERAAIVGLVGRCPVAQRGQRVLVDRSPGMEDSSRYWSVWMTLDHLRITNLAFAMAVGSLAKGEVPSRKASTADVKPDPKVDASVEAAFASSCENYLRVERSIDALRTPLRYEHPWFGPLDAAGWHALAAGHLAIHRRQLENILKGLGEG